MKKHYFGALALLLCSVISLVSCTDERFYVDDEEIGQGVASISAEALFKNFTPALDGGTSRGVAGTVIDGIKNLYLFAYNSETGELACTTSFSTDPNGGLTVVKDNGMTPPDGSYDPTGSANLPTSRADFNFSLPYGKYRIYAVANVGEADKGKLAADKVPTASELKKVQFAWSDNIEEDGQMFGVFTTEALKDSPASTFDAPEVVIKNSDVKLGAWLRRLASKVTVAYDPSGLKEAVTIFIKSATLHHIPKECTLGESNTPKSLDELTTGPSISYVTSGTDASNHSNWLKLQKGSGSKGSTEHLHGDESLFFYENNQGDYAGKGKEYCKVQNADEMGENTFYPDQTTPGGSDKYVDWKDKVPYGTFIEVEAYYLSQNKEKPSSGPIKYRFMLGKDVTYNYDAERNYHFKLTLKFNNWANEPDWHVDYDEPDPGIFVPEEYFISYLYNQTMQMPVRLTNAEGISKLRAEIIENNWAPYDPRYADEVPEQPTLDLTNYNQFTWNKEAYDKFNKTYNDWNAYRGHANFLGFLSLRKTTETVIGEESTNYGVSAMTELQNYYSQNQRWFAEYDITKAGDADIDGKVDDGSYSVKRDGNDVTVLVPMWTRAKQMIPMSAFTANNPYDSYRRKAVVRFYALDASGKQVPFKDLQGSEVLYKDVPIFQVRRIVNPKAIWRAANNAESFDINLSILETPTATTFTPLPSSGPWRASILVDNGGLIKISKDGKVVTTVNDGNTENEKNYIYGSTGSYMTFKYEPNGTIGADKSRSGIIMVEYQDYTCVHYIFVRQGYDAPALLGGKNWSCYNVYAMAGSSSQPQNRRSAGNMKVMTTSSPLSIGSFFKRANYQDGILESNNLKYGLYVPINGKSLDVVTLNANGTTKKASKLWSAIPAYGAANLGGNESWTETLSAVNHSNQQFKLPTYDDYHKLREAGQGFGVVYGDGATSQATTIEDAYGYIDTDNSGLKSSKGIRACVVYDKTTGQQIILPIGVVGQGRRARQVYAINGVTLPAGATNTSTGNIPIKGTLSYSGVYGPLDGGNNVYRPIAYNLYRNPGAIYWFETPKIGGHTSNGDNSYSWDINYFSFEFGPYDSASLGSGTSVPNLSDALPIRLIYK